LIQRQNTAHLWGGHSQNINLSECFAYKPLIKKLSDIGLPNLPHKAA
jgi:hypothetical protein